MVREVADVAVELQLVGGEFPFVFDRDLPSGIFTGSVNEISSFVTLPFPILLSDFWP